MAAAISSAGVVPHPFASPEAGWRATFRASEGVLMAPLPRWRVPNHRAEACWAYVFIKQNLGLCASPRQYLESALAIAWNYGLEFKSKSGQAKTAHGFR